MQSSVYTGTLMHHRFKPKKHRFSYRVASWLLDLDELAELDRKLKLFSVSRFNLVSFYPTDYGNGSETPLKEQVLQLLQQHNMTPPDSIRILCYPRIMGYTFNPLAVYFCYKEQRLTAIIYEVSNTFGERHAYLAETDDQSFFQHDKTVLQQKAVKLLHVSPFFPMNCSYHFRTRPPADQVTLGINLNDDNGKLFTAVFNGQQQNIDDGSILKQALLIPLQTLKVVGAIHWEALRLWLKGIAIHTHKPKDEFYSHSRAHSLMNRENK